MSRPQGLRVRVPPRAFLKNMIDGESPIVVSLTDEQQKMIDIHFPEGRKLSTDTFNYWSSAAMLADAEMFNEMPEIPFYRDTFPKYTPAELAYTLQKSDPVAIAEYDALVNEYNNDLPRIKKEKDAETAKVFARKADKLIRGKDLIG